MKRIKQLVIIITMGLFAACSSSDDNFKPEPKPEPGPEKPETEFTLPDKDMRAVWFTTVWELDWPQKIYNVEAQKKLYIKYLDSFVKYNINTVFVQVRSMADAFYKSSYEPWSKNITGERGKDPGYDVFQFMLEEAHKRDLEFHAWINPYRIATKADGGNFPAIDFDIKPDMYVDYGNTRVYNPALPEVRQRLTDIIDEIITNYDIDGVVLDDYFYPSPISGIEFPDDEEFKQYGGNFKTKEEFRIDNVNQMVKGIHDLIVKKKPQLAFTVSPASDHNYNLKKLYADVEHWCKEGWLDIVMPQLYHAKNVFSDRLAYWARFSYEATPMVAYGLYKFGDASQGPDYSKQELTSQYSQVARNNRIKGGSYYSAKYILENRIDIMDVVAKQYADPALRPFVGREISPQPKAPTALELVDNELRWKSDNNLTSAVYVLPYTKTTKGDITGKERKARLVTITKENKCKLTIKGEYFISSSNRQNMESKLSESIVYK